MAKLSKKKIAIIVVASVLVVAIILCVTLVSVHFGTLEFPDPFGFYDIPIQRVEGLEDCTISTVDSGEYLAHPDLVYTGDKLVTMYVKGHGRGEIITKTADPDDLKWSSRVEGTPKSWEKSLETPTLYKLDFVGQDGELNGESCFIMISGRPQWSGTSIKADGFQYSLSNDGDKWTEYTICYDKSVGNPYDCIVAMSSLTQLKENGKFVNKWLGTFHDHDFHNYKTILTFEQNPDGSLKFDGGGYPIAHWSKPEYMFANFRAQEESYNICEVEIIRTPKQAGEERLSGDTLILLGRANAHKTGSVIMFSDDEGATWTDFKELPYELTGERHKAEYDPTTNKLLVCFRQVVPVVGHSAIVKKIENIAAKAWMAWVGTFDDLLSYRTNTPTKGEKMLILGETYGKKASDCGYCGTVCIDGKFILVGYGSFDINAKDPYIRCVSFRLS